MIEALSSNEGSEDLTKRAVIDLKADLSQKTLTDFVTKSSRMFFVTLGIDDGFLETDPAKWHDALATWAAARKVNGTRGTKRLRRAWRPPDGRLKFDPHQGRDRARSTS
ncbi:hypothetical protein GWK47_045318 [Chionoecetes opilio]|uniref:Uncharacterized protein n=1 Tax=Chionoecetes opilio TaxID=41210 RepID=A0A8J4YFL3_CHIOP|nr:hypothetical protein GWK47_045318 [Chionoecetes opilio]